MNDLDINAIRVLSIDMIENAKSGHPGICLGSAPIIHELFSNSLNIYAKESSWINRDRFVLSAGHGSAMLYAGLHLSGFDLSINDLKKFRQLNSKTPGHPEYGYTDGVDATTGPLGQGIATGIGMAVAEAHLGAKYNKKDFNIFDHYTYILCGDGDLQEGISGEASAFAGHNKLNKVILLWDSNDIQLDDRTEKVSTENVLKRYEAYGWNTLYVKDVNDKEELQQAINNAKSSDKPTIIEVKTIIGCGSTREGSNEIHGVALGEEDAKHAKESYGWTYEPFFIPDEIYTNYQKNSLENGKVQFNNWNKLLEDYKINYPEDYKNLEISLASKDFDIKNLDFDLNSSEASRVSSQKAINNINEQIPNLIGGSADLSKSNNTYIDMGMGAFEKDNYIGQNIYYGVREFAMAGISNGIVLHGGLKSFCATFFVFSDYLKPAIRLSALQEIPSIYVFTHDSIFVGEDGPTHEPIEQLAGLRAIPNVDVIRPADANETQAAWKKAINSKKTPTILVLTRQNLEVVTKSNEVDSNLGKGAYILKNDDKTKINIIATGSEVNLAYKVSQELDKDNISSKIISMPSTNIFDKQPEDYKNKIINDKSKNLFLELSTAEIGYKYADHVYGLNRFGKSGKGDEVAKTLGFDPKDIANYIKQNIIK